MQVFDELKFSSVPFTIDELTRKLKGKEDRPLLLQPKYLLPMLPVHLGETELFIYEKHSQGVRIPASPKKVLT